MSAKFLWEKDVPESGVAHLQTDFLLSQESTINLPRDVSEDMVPLMSLVRRLLNIQGVQSIIVARYKVRVERTKLVDWTVICPAVERAIEEYISITYPGIC